MKQSINKDNYEAFYLDFLEGNLSKEQEVLLLAFLDEHPELKVDEDWSDCHFSADSTSLDSDWKAMLKLDLTSEAIQESNVDTFLIAELENELDANKQLELASFLQANPAFEKERMLYTQTRLHPDFSLSYPDKKGLKKTTGRIIPLYVRYAAVAAGLVFVFTLTQFQSVDSVYSPRQFSQTNSSEEPDSDQANPSISEKKPNGLSDVQNRTIQLVSVPQTDGSIPVNPTEKPSRGSVNSLKFKKVRPVSTGTLMREPIESQPVFAQEYNQENANTAMIGYEEMKNPIKPVTAKISEIIKQDVDFRTSKAAKKRAGGFYLKIGKLEISRKVYETERVAAK